MFYTPKYCCNCAEQIESADRSLMSSGRFCEVCAIEFKGVELLPKIVAGLLLAVGLFGAGSWLMTLKKSGDSRAAQISQVVSKPRQETDNRQISANNQVNAAAPSQSAANSPAQTAPVAQKQPAQNFSPNLSPNQAAKASDTETNADEPVYYCGAATKKGTPCSRRVKGGGRCWQHQGQPAILPPDKLRVIR